MLTYKAMYKFLDQGIHAEVLDFPGTITLGTTLEEARRLLAIWENSTTNCRTSIPRHREIPEFTAVRICKQLGIPEPS